MYQDNNFLCSMEPPLTFGKLEKIIKKYNIPSDVVFYSDSGWECGETDMCGLFYSREKNTIVFTQNLGVVGYPTKYELDGYMFIPLELDE